jgi:hypothetical protein
MTDTSRTQLFRNEVAELRIAVRSKLRWPLGLELRMSVTAPIFNLSQPRYGDSNGPTTIDGYICKSLEDIMAGLPTILNKNWGEAKGGESKAIYEPPQPRPEEEASVQAVGMLIHE